MGAVARRRGVWHFARMPRALAAAAALLFSTLTMPHAAAAPFTAGEAMRATTSQSAAIRNHGNPALRILVWYPATATEHEVDFGPPGHPVFMTGQVAANAPFADAARHPLVLLSHGFGGVARQLTWLGAALARHGYVVVAVDHPGTNGRDGVTAEGAYAPWERVGDLTAALDLVLADRQLGPHIDVARIGAAGFSLGGFTASLLVGARTDFPHLTQFCNGPQRDAICDPQLEFPTDLHQQPAVLARPDMRDIVARRDSDFRDPRIKAAFLIAPALGQAMNQASLTQIHVPVEIALGDADPVAPPKTNGAFLARMIPGARLRLLPGVGHYDFLSECGAAGATAAKAYCTDGRGTNRAQTHAATIAEAITFFDATIAR
jgi:predicted dienelactone hydrolase